MKVQRSRLGIRAQVTIIVLLGAILSTAATLFVANRAIESYALQQAQNQEKENMKIARLVLQTQYGQTTSITSDGILVADYPTNGNSAGSPSSLPNYGKYPLGSDTGSEYVDAVKQLIGGYISVYQCADKTDQPTYDAHGVVNSCMRIATTLTHSNQATGNIPVRELGVKLGQDSSGQNIAQQMGLERHNLEKDLQPQEWQGQEALDGKQFYSDYYPLLGPQSQFIGVLHVGVPLDTVTAFQQRTSIELLLLGVIIMIGGVILALLFASAIISTLQRAARQVSGASERIGGIAAQQAGGAAQQVWAVNAINKALQNFTEMARDISQRTDQLGLMGNQVIQRRGEIPPAQIDSILAYMTRSVRDISVASRQQATQYERMSGAMQAVIEIAEQVAENSEQSTQSAERLDLVVGQLQQLVGVRRLGGRANADDEAFEAMSQMESQMGSQMDGAGAMAGGPPSRGMGQPQPGMGLAPVGRAGMDHRVGAGMGAGRMAGGAEQNWGAMPPLPAMPQAMPGMPGMGGGVPGPYGAPGAPSDMPPSGSARRWMRPPSDNRMPSGALGSAYGGGPGGGQNRRMPPGQQMPPLPQMPQMPSGRMPRNGDERAPSRPMPPDPYRRGGWDDQDPGYDQRMPGQDGGPNYG